MTQREQVPTLIMLLNLKSMKKILIISAFLITSLSSFSQTLFGVWTPASGTNTYATSITGFSSNANKVIWVKFQNANTGASTITINSIISAVPIRKWSGSAWVVLSGGELDVNTIYQMKYSGSYYALEVFSASGGGALTPGSGTTPNATAVDLGGTQTSNAVISGDGGTYGMTFDEQEHFTVNVQGGNNANTTVADGGDINLTSNSGYINLTTFGGNGTQIVASGTGYAFSVTGSGILANVNSDATGDLLYRNSSGYLARRGIGSTGNVLTVSGGLPTWATASVAVGGITGLGTGVATALGINIGSAGSFVTNGGALGTPSSGVATNLTGTASGLTAGTVTTNANLIGDVLSSGNTTTYSGTVPINKGGSGQTTANTALNAFLPSQASANGKVLQSDGTNTSWQTPSAGFVNPMTSVGDIIQGSTAGAAVRLASVATGNALISGGVTTANSWGKITSSHIDATIQPTASPTFTGTVTFPTPWTLGATSVASTGTQLNYLNAATGTTGTTSTNLVYSTSPTLVTPVLGTVAAGSILTNATGLPVATGISGLGTGVATAAAINSGSTGSLLVNPTNASGVLTNNGSGGLSWAAAGGTGTVSSVGLSLPSIITVSNSPVTTTGTLTGTLAAQNNSTHFVGPLPVTFGNTAAPTFRTLENSDMYFRNKYKVAMTGTPFIFGDSYSQSQQATSTAIGFVKQLAGINGFTENNQGVSGRGISVAAYASYSSMPTFNNGSSSIVLIGFNDLRRNGSASATLTKIAGGLRAIVANTWLKFGIAASGVTNTGTWSNYTNANGVFKAVNLSGNARQSSTSGDLLTYTTTTASDNIVIGTVNCDGTTANLGRFTVSIDGTIVQTFDPSGRTDAVSDGAQDNSVVPEALIFTGLKNSTHVIILTLLDNKATVIDYIGYMREPAYCAGILIATSPRMDATGYAIAPASATDAVITTSKATYKTVCESFVDRPIVYVDLDQFWNVSTSLGADHIHPNDQGYTDIKTAFQSAIMSNQFAAGTPLNLVTAATTSNTTVDNANNPIKWSWNTLGGSNVGFELASTSASAAPAAPLFKANFTGTNSSSALTTYAGQFLNLRTGTTAVNVAIYANASSGAGQNYALLAAAGKIAQGSANPTLPTTDTNIQTLGATSNTLDVAGTSSFARILLRDLGQSSGSRNWSILNSGANFSIDRVNDAVNSTTNRFLITSAGQYGFNVTSPTAIIHLPAGTATASTAPMKFTAPAALLTTPEALVVEPAINGDYLNLTTTTGTIRRVIVAGSSGRATAQTAANNSVATYTLGATDASYEVSANVLVTTSSAENFTVTVSYTDEGNTARVLTMNFQTIGGTIGTTVAFANGAVPYEGLVTHLRCKASTSITVKTVGTFTGATYNVEGIIKQTN